MPQMVQHKLEAVSLNGICHKVNLFTACSCQQEAQSDPHPHTHIPRESHTRPGLTHDLRWMSKPHWNLVEWSEIFARRQCITSGQELQALRSKLTLHCEKPSNALVALRSSAIFNCKCQHMLRGIALTNALFQQGSCTLSLCLGNLSYFPQISQLPFKGFCLLRKIIIKC